MKNSMKYFAAPLVGALLVASLAACSADSGPDTAPSPASSSAAAAATPVPEVTAGQTLDAEPEALPEGAKAFELADGTYVVTTPDAPLPASVLEVAATTMSERILEVQVDAQVPQSPGAVTDSAQGVASSLSSQTGKQVVIIFPLGGSCSAQEDGYVGWGYTRVGPDDKELYACGLERTLEGVQARVADLISRQANPSVFEVIVHEG